MPERDPVEQDQRSKARDRERPQGVGREHDPLRFQRSAATPASRLRSACGSIRAKPTTPAFAGDCVTASVNSGYAITVSCVPIEENSRPAWNSAKSRLRRRGAMLVSPGIEARAYGSSTLLAMAASKRQTTHAKMAREQKMRERRLLKQEKKDDKKLAAESGEPVVEEESEFVNLNDPNLGRSSG